MAFRFSSVLSGIFAQGMGLEKMVDPVAEKKKRKGQNKPEKRK